MNDIDFKEENNEQMPESELENEGRDNDKKFEHREILTQEKDKTLEKIYQENDFQKIHKPPKMPTRILMISIIISLIFGLLIGFFGAIFLLSKKEINLPFFGKINFENILPKIV